eukprot:GHVS01028429.1.p1 GENE.GHVS01028429.1~~GHVS01028429.1.p1  ORF type:complete len:130 (+),score=18.42 GHVS01028429.1:145-534(+)
MFLLLCVNSLLLVHFAFAATGGAPDMHRPCSVTVVVFALSPAAPTEQQNQRQIAIRLFRSNRLLPHTNSQRETPINNYCAVAVHCVCLCVCHHEVTTAAFTGCGGYYLLCQSMHMSTCIISPDVQRHGR